MGGDMLAARRAWLDHYHACPACQRREPCPAGLDLIGWMRAGMAPEESLPEWMASVRPMGIGLT